jgi:hypothetical protein
MATIQMKSSSDVEEYSEREPIPDRSVFEAEILSIDLRDTPFDDEHSDVPRKKQQFNFKLNITEEGPFLNRYVWGSVGEWFSDDPRCRMTQWVRAILDTDILPADFAFDTEDLVGEKCRVVIGSKKRATSVEGKPDMLNFVQEIRPSKGVPANSVAVQASTPVANQPSNAPAYNPDEEPFN